MRHASMQTTMDFYANVDDSLHEAIGMVQWGDAGSVPLAVPPSGNRSADDDANQPHDSAQPVESQWISGEGGIRTPEGR